MQQLSTYTTGDEVADSKQFARNQFIEKLSQYSGFSKDSLQKTFTVLSSMGLVLEAAKGGRYITFDGKYYVADNLKFSKNYYEKLWGIGGRPAPFLQAEEILKSKPTVTPDPNKKAGFL
ncbi:hypothetical protein [Brenneria rubrifaciens]|uniref:Uncharacterized protein n=1 Tax=Brenneria rubrifaciens TaxID=55213 RepID=A0A4P8QSE3_9GAMM|nr:hypothetical protein [Brenneria rubrifaciens]QCR10101.1 hypothetical protein EH207_17320 [Brenneria rubrifaciens]